MAYSNYLIKIGNYTFPMNKIEEKTYSAKVNTLDEDSYNDASGLLHRTVIQRVPKVKFSTLPMTESELRPILAGIQANYSVTEERKASISAWIPEWGEYVTQNMFMSDTDFNIDYIIDGTIMYDSIQFTFTGYGV